MEDRKNPAQIASPETPWQERTAWIHERLQEIFPRPNVARHNTRGLSFILSGEKPGLDKRFSAFLITYGKFEPLANYSAPAGTFTNRGGKTCLRKDWAHPEDAKKMRETIKKRDPGAWTLFEDQINWAREKSEDAEAEPAAIRGDAQLKSEITQVGNTVGTFAVSLQDLQHRVSALEDRLNAMDNDNR